MVAWRHEVEQGDSTPRHAARRRRGGGRAVRLHRHARVQRPAPAARRAGHGRHRSRSGPLPSFLRRRALGPGVHRLPAAL
ncbi:hypothetical protein DWB68_14825 [Galactobacter valiniphilus]|uniref:Uncharacterized protein n=1 Tax=Galactobacter valiniphilus TaxID=2676122 RepID=A0A399J921_9MICC|nr:hypothetical protein DWB68_14825 [Galactobacter valiniphilus]